MHRRFRTSISLIVLIGALIAVSGLLTACGGGGGSDQQSDRQSRLEELRAQKEELDTAREELAALEERLERAEAGEPPPEGVEPLRESGPAEGAEPAEGESEQAAADEPETPELLRAKIDEKNADITEMAEKLNADLVAFINEDPPVQGEPIEPVVQDAFALKAREDMVLAEEYMSEGGDYARAISIYDDILRTPLSDEMTQEVEAARERAQDLRYMDEERFAQVKEGMSRDEVREVLGPVNPRNRRDFPEREVVAWFYPKSEKKDAAAVWFRKKGDDYEVYRTDFDAVTKEEAQEEG